MLGHLGGRHPWVVLLLAVSISGQSAKAQLANTTQPSSAAPASSARNGKQLTASGASAAGIPTDIGKSLNRYYCQSLINIGKPTERDSSLLQWLPKNYCLSLSQRRLSNKNVTNVWSLDHKRQHRQKSEEGGGGQSILHLLLTGNSPLKSQNHLGIGSFSAFALADYPMFRIVPIVPHIGNFPG